MAAVEGMTKCIRPGASRSLPFYGCLSWIVGLVPKARQSGGLKEEDIPCLPKSIQSEQALAAATIAWAEQSSKSKPRSILRVLVSTSRFDVYVNVCFGIVMGLVQCLARPVAVRLMVQAAKAQKDPSEAVFELAVVGIVIFLEGLTWMITRHAACDIGGTRTMAALSGLILSKAARILDTNKQTSDEKVLVAVDAVGKVNSSFSILSFFVSNMLGLTVGGLFALITIGPSTFAGLAVGFMGMYLTQSSSTAASRYDKAAVEQTDKRVKTLNEILTNMKGVKIHAWEDQFLERMEGFRAEETRNYSLWHKVRSVGVNVGRALPVLCSCVTFSTYALSGGDLTPEVVFPTLAVFQGMRMPMVLLPMNIVSLSTFAVSLKRIEAFLGAAEAPTRSPLPAGPTLATVNKVQVGFFSDNSFTPVLTDVSCNVQAGEIVGIVGPVASGKSSLLSALLGELPLEAGTASTVASIGFAPQKPAVISGTLAENIFVGRKPDAARLDEVLRMCCFEEDLAQLVDGLETEIGERGVTLSGGQQQRLAIARAMYDSPNLLVLDDPLSAVDVRTGAFLMDSLVEYAHGGKERGVIMVLNQPQCLALCDKVVVLGDGGVLAVGSPKEVFAEALPQNDTRSRRSVDFFSLMAAAAMAPSQEAFDGPAEAKKPVAKAGDQKVAAAAPDSKGAQNMRNSFQLVKADVRQQGTMKRQVYRDIVQSMGVARMSGVLLMFLFSSICYGMNDLWLIHWTQGGSDTTIGVAVLVVATLLYAGSSTWAAQLWYSAAAVGGRRVFHDCMQAVIRAPLGWFDETPSGRITSRFSGDLHGMDTTFAQFSEALAQFVFLELAVLATSTYLNPYFGVIAAIYLGMVYLVFLQVAALNRDVKRFGNLALSPVLTNLTELRVCRQAGLLRPMQLQSFFIARHHIHMEAYCRCWYTGMTLVSWGNFVFYFLTAVMSIASAYVILWSKPSPASAGLQIVYCFILPFTINLTVTLYFQVAVSFTQLERIFEMKVVPQEAIQGTCGVSGEWPTDGAISFRGATLRYKPELPPSLQDINLEIQSGWRVGLCGRTGSGKSSLLVMLLRLVELDKGSILLGGQSLRDIDLDAVRRAVAMIPQEPFLMQGSVRRNLDPFGDRTDEEITSALERVGLNYTLDDAVTGGGSNLSAGERQLLSFSRILLRDAKVVLLDEPTSSLDPMTDAKMGELVRSACAGRTVLTIAHRLKTIRDSDLVVVLSNGSIAESGSPEELLKRLGSQYGQMVKLGGMDIADNAVEVEDDAGDCAGVVDITIGDEAFKVASI